MRKIILTMFILISIIVLSTDIDQKFDEIVDNLDKNEINYIHKKSNTDYIFINLSYNKNILNHSTELYDDFRLLSPPLEEELAYITLFNGKRSVFEYDNYYVNSIISNYRSLISITIT